MAENSKIEWTDHTANLWWGCSKVHEGCANCYAEKWSGRYDGGTSLWGDDAERREIKGVWKSLEKFQRDADREGVFKRVFIGSMMDIFEKPMMLQGKDYTTSSLREVLFNNIELGCYPNLLFLFLTKRPSNINKHIPINWLESPPNNVMFGTSISNHKTYNTLTRQLLAVKGKRFLSIEPQLAKIHLGDLKGVDWIIQGGESGAKKRTFDIAWARIMRDECKSLGIPYFFKQIDKIEAIPEDMLVREFPCYNLPK